MTNQGSSVLAKNTIAIVVGVAFVAGLAGGFLGTVAGRSDYFASTLGGVNAVSKNTVEQKTYVEESQTVDSIKKVSPAVISIVATQDLKVYKNQPQTFNIDPFGGFQFNVPNQQPQSGGKEGTDYEVQHQKIGGGSGFIISNDGLVLTNRHVVANDQVEYTVVTNDGTEYDGDVVSIDPLNDLAVVQMVKKGELSKKKEERTKLKDLPVVEFGDSSKLEVGQKVLAIGYALGQYQNTVTSGIISAKGRAITAAGGEQGSEALSNLLQTDAAINPGNSGGPLINLAGQVIGVNVAIDATGSSIGFAIPIDEVKPALESVQKFGKIIRPTLGVRHMILTKEKAKELKLDVDHGALLVGDEANGEFAVIPGSPADKAGLKIRDVILSVDDKDITTDYTLQAVVSSHKPGDEITLKVWRSGTTLTIKVKLDQAKDEAALRNVKA